MAKNAGSRSAIDEIFFFIGSTEVIVVLVASFLMVFGGLDSWFGRGEFFVLVARVFPFLGNYVRKSSFENVAKFYFPVMFFVDLLVGVHVVRCREAYIGKLKQKLEIEPGKYKFFSIALALFFFLGAYFMIFFDEGDAFAITPIASSGLSLAMYGWIYSGGVVWFSVAMVVNLIHLVRE